MQIELQFVVPSTLAPKSTVYVPPVGGPVVTRHPVNISITGLKNGDLAPISGYQAGITTSSGSDNIEIVSITDDTLTIQNKSTTVNETVSGNLKITRNVEPFKSYTATTDASGYVTVNHELYKTPIKWLMSSSVDSSGNPITLCVVSSNSASVTLRAFVGITPVISSVINFSLYVG